MSIPNELPVSRIKRAQKESNIYKILSKLYVVACSDDPRLLDLSISRVSLSADKSMCYVNFFNTAGREKFDNLLKVLKLYRASMRRALAQQTSSRYVPNLRFVFDDQMLKQIHIEQLLDTVKDDPSQEEDANSNDSE